MLRVLFFLLGMKIPTGAVNSLGEFINEISSAK